MNIEIRPLSTPEDCKHLQHVERLIWGAPDEDLIPVHVAITVLKNGGGALGAFSADGPAETGGMVGMTLWFMGSGPDPRTGRIGVKACSHIMGTLPAWRGRRVGARLKLAQRDAVLAQGVTDWMTWTYDPLFVANAVLNIHRLGGASNTYIRNIYGIMEDELNAGVPSDRLQVDWLLRDASILTSIDERRPIQAWERDSLRILPSTVRADGLHAPGAADFGAGDAALAVPIPTDIAAIRRVDSALSMQWRLYLRTTLERAFEEGYTVVECVKLPDQGWHYILNPKEPV